MALAADGRGYLYVRPDLIETLQPKTTGWMAHEHPFAFETEMHYAPNIAGFLHGSPAISKLYMRPSQATRSSMRSA